jgi:undecaprenyl-diphosphatase
MRERLVGGAADRGASHPHLDPPDLTIMMRFNGQGRQFPFNFAADQRPRAWLSTGRVAIRVMAVYRASRSMQLAALTAVITYFWRDVRALAVHSIVAIAHRQFQDRYFRFSIWIILATIPIGIAGLLAAKLLNTCQSPVRSITIIGWACVAMALLLAIAEIYARHRRTIDQAYLTDALLIGLAQTGALIPGVSRSGSTLTAALALGFKRDEAARLSFLLGLPAIALAGLKELWELYKVHLEPQAWTVLAVGLAVASVSAFFAIWGLMRVLERFSSWPFVIYRFALGVVILAGAIAGRLS